MLKFNVAICSIVRLMMMTLNGRHPHPHPTTPPLVLHPDGPNGKRLQQSGQHTRTHTGFGRPWWPVMTAITEGVAIVSAAVSAAARQTHTCTLIQTCGLVPNSIHTHRCCDMPAVSCVRAFKHAHNTTTPVHVQRSAVSHSHSA